MPGVQVPTIAAVLLSLLLKHAPSGLNELLFFLREQPSHHDLNPQEDKIAVQDIAAAVFADFGELPGSIHVENHIPLNVKFAGFRQERCGKIQSTSKPCAAVIGEDIMQIDMRF